MDFSKVQIKEAIETIDKNPDLRKGRKSQKYDLIHNNESYPPILVLSVANKLNGGNELTLSDFSNSIDKPFQILTNNGFMIEEKSQTLGLNFDPDENNAWIEKTIIKDKPARHKGPYRLGKRLWSPRKDKGGADIYKYMREVKPGDLIIHLVNNQKIYGVSIAKKSFQEGQGVRGSKWEGEAYIIELTGYKSIDPIDRSLILNNTNKFILDEIRNKHNVFYTKNLNLRQGAYLTECPLDLLQILNSTFKNTTKKDLPYLDSSIFDEDIMATHNSSSLITNFCKDITSSNLIFDNVVSSRFIISLTTKPFLILTGLSGSGKTKIAQAFTSWISKSNNQINIVSVGADWTNREPLLGYPNALEHKQYVLPDSGVLQLLINAQNNPDHPYFLILDEMNLSHVERYFADFLSAMESGEKIHLHSGKSEWNGVPPSIKIPENLFVIGTVNIDETTYMFSPKVLDRANVIEFCIDTEEIESFLQNSNDVDLEAIKGKGAPMAKHFVQISKNPAQKVNKEEELNKELLNFFNELKKVGAEFGYRSAYEIHRLAGITNNMAEDWSIQEIIDIAVVQKLLPKLHGSRRKLEPILETLANLCAKDDKEAEKALSKPYEFDFNDPSVKYPISLEKIARMHKRLLKNGFTSFAEA